MDFKSRREMTNYGLTIHKTQEYAKDPHAALVAFSSIFLDKIRLAPDKLLVATYRRPERTEGGLYMTESSLDEDKFQGAAGLILKAGSKVFVDDSATTFGGFSAKELEWVTYRPSYGVAREFAGLHCRIIQDRHVDAVVEDPTLVW